MTNALQVAYKTAFQLSPILLVGGVAAAMPASLNVLPIMGILDLGSIAGSLLSGNLGFDTDRFFAHFEPAPGATLIEQQVATYPFANQSVAANAVITQPLKVSMIMKCPVQSFGGYWTKLATMMSFKSVLERHNATGGTYIVATPSYFYSNCVMTGMTDVSGGDTKQHQVTWQLDFMQPLLTLAQAQAAQNGLMSKLSGGLPTSGAWSGISSTMGSPQSIATGSVVPSAAGIQGAASRATSSLGG